jgi:hypothetical protein
MYMTNVCGNIYIFIYDSGKWHGRHCVIRLSEDCVKGLVDAIGNEVNVSTDEPITQQLAWKNLYHEIDRLFTPWFVEVYSPFCKVGIEKSERLTGKYLKSELQKPVKDFSHFTGSHKGPAYETSKTSVSYMGYPIRVWSGTLVLGDLSGMECEPLTAQQTIVEPLTAQQTNADCMVDSDTISDNDSRGKGKKEQRKSSRNIRWYPVANTIFGRVEVQVQEVKVWRYEEVQLDMLRRAGQGEEPLLYLKNYKEQAIGFLDKKFMEDIRNTDTESSADYFKKIVSKRITFIPVLENDPSIWCVLAILVNSEKILIVQFGGSKTKGVKRVQTFLSKLDAVQEYVREYEIVFLKSGNKETETDETLPYCVPSESAYRCGIIVQVICKQWYETEGTIESTWFKSITVKDWEKKLYRCSQRAKVSMKQFWMPQKNNEFNIFQKLDTTSKGMVHNEIDYHKKCSGRYEFISACGEEILYSEAFIKLAAPAKDGDTTEVWLVTAIIDYFMAVMKEVNPDFYYASVEAGRNVVNNWNTGR